MKLEFKGTKGNWHYRKNGRNFIKILRGDKKIASINQSNNNCIDEVNEANAKLISAAPELLEFAQEMVRRYPNSPWIYEQAQKTIEKALK